MDGISGGGLIPPPHINHGHGYSYTRSRGAKGERLPPPFAMPRIPSERFDTREEDQQDSSEPQSLAPPDGSRGFTGHRRQHPLSLGETPSFQTNGYEQAPARPKSMDVSLLPLRTPTSSTFGEDHNDIQIEEQDRDSMAQNASLFE